MFKLSFMRNFWKLSVYNGWRAIAIAIDEIVHHLDILGFDKKTRVKRINNIE